MREVHVLVFGLSAFIALLNFKPSEPYLSQYLICNEKAAEELCHSNSLPTTCSSSSIICQWNSFDGQCNAKSCNNLTSSQCQNADFNFCVQTHNQCEPQTCYEDFTDAEVNNDIYPWSTFAYLPFLLILGPFAELYSYRVAILLGVLGRVATRVILLYGKSLQEMQLMQVSYSLGTAAEDVFSAYIYYVISTEHYQYATSAIKAAALISCVVSGVLGDILVVKYNTSLTVLMWISAAFVWAGFMMGLFVIRPPRNDFAANGQSSHSASLIAFKEDSNDHQSPQRTKLQIFLHQLQCLRIALQSRTVQTMLLLWVIGNAVFQTLYDYEVSIYQELQGENSSWNGSVLAIMLVAGSIGAMLPVLEVDPLSMLLRSLLGKSNENLDNQDKETHDNVLEHTSQKVLVSRESTKNSLKDEEIVTASRIMLASILASGSLIGVIATWCVIPSVSFLAMFFATWQYVNVIVFARFALYLKRAEELQRRTGFQASYEQLSTSESILHERQGEHKSNDREEDVDTVDPPYSFAIVMIIAANVLIQILLQLACFSLLQLSLYTACCYMAYVFISTAGVYILLALAQSSLQVYIRSWQLWWISL